MIRFTRGRRRSSVVLGAAVVALAFGVSVGLAKSGPSQYSRLKLFDDPPNTCPPPVNGKDPHSFGQASLQRSKGIVMVRVHMHDAAPGTYIVQLALFDPIAMNCISTYGPLIITEFKVDSGGDGNGSGTFPDEVPAGGFFVVASFSEDANGGLGATYITNPVKLGST